MERKKNTYINDTSSLIENAPIFHSHKTRGSKIYPNSTSQI